jgi:hypothetical protein
MGRSVVSHHNRGAGHAIPAEDSDLDPAIPITDCYDRAEAALGEVDIVDRRLSQLKLHAKVEGNRQQVRHDQICVGLA